MLERASRRPPEGNELMGYSCFDVEMTGTDGQVAHLRLNRPEALNSMTREFWMELPEIVAGLDAEGRARAVVLSSTGKHFSAGMDLAVRIRTRVAAPRPAGAARSSARRP
jgi:enoyl-CoA hydratase/carnithine racemase